MSYFGLSPLGNYVYAVGEKTGQIIVQEIEKHVEAMKKAEPVITGHGPNAHHIYITRIKKLLA